jgi:hypothetical protein
MSIHVESGAAIVGPKGARSNLHALADIPDAIPFWNVGGTPEMVDRIGAAKTAVVRVCLRSGQLFDTTGTV